MRMRFYATAIVASLVTGLLQAASANGEISPLVATVQAEHMRLPVGSSVVNDVTASGGQTAKMTQSGTSLTGQVSLPRSATSLTLIAKGRKLSGAWPKMSMLVDGRTVIPLTTVSYSGWQTYSASVSLGMGTHTLSVISSNTSVSGRYLFVDVIRFQALATAPISQPSAGISSTYFGEHILGPLEKNLSGSGVPLTWPSWSPTTVRLWNTYGYNASKGSYSGISWKSLNPAPGVYDWTVFDAALAKHKAQGVTDLIYTFGYTPTWAGGGTNHDQAPSNTQYLTDFATAVARRAVENGLPIRNWEVWNEPNNGVGTWTGTNTQMVAMARTIHGAVKAVDPSYKVLTPSPQGNATIWMNNYLAAGGGAYADVMAFHGYTSSAPETIAALIDSYKKVYATHGQSSKPIWDTEAMDLTTSDPTMQAKFLAIYYLLHQAKGVSRLYWYAYDADQGQEWFYTSGLNATGMANQQIHSWMLAATPGSLLQSGSVYSLPLTKGSQKTIAVWNSAGTSAYSAGTYTNYTDLKGVVRPVIGGTVNIGTSPILLW